MEKIILDCDPGIDDALAIFLAAASPDIEILAVTTVAGNRPVECTTHNARKLLNFVGSHHVPVYMGSETPLAYSEPRCNLVHGEDGLGGVKLDEFADSNFQPVAGEASEHILRILREEPTGSVTLVTIGPLTNIAIALSKDPTTMMRVKRIVCMGGAIYCKGNVTPLAEFNFWADAIAANRVISANLPIMLFGIDVTSKAICNRQWLKDIAALPNRCGKLIAEMTQSYFAKDPILHDPCPIAWLMNPGLFESHSCYVEVDWRLGVTEGKTVGWPTERLDAPATANAIVVDNVNNPALLALMLENYARLP